MPEFVVTRDGSTVVGTSDADIFRGPNDGWMIDGPSRLIGGDGNDTYYKGKYAQVIEQKNGGYDVVVSSVSTIIPDNVEQLNLWRNIAGYGNADDNVIFGAGNNLIDGGLGNDILNGGRGTSVFQFSAGSGHDVVADWSYLNVVRFAGYESFQSLSDVRASMTQVGANVVLKLDAGNDVTFNNTTIDFFMESNFQYRFSPKDLHLSFNDDFNTFSARPTRTSATGIWSTELGDSRGSDALESRTLMSNNEKQIYVDPYMKGTGKSALGLNPFSVDDGVLSITAQKTPDFARSSLYNYDYTSGYISTRDTFAQTYGYFEARLQLPAATGSWPAFWLFRKDGVWPPELDIMEAWNDTTAVGTVHTQQSGSHTMTSGSAWVPNGDTSFHDYGFLWTSEKLTWYLDGVEVFSKPTPADMHSPMYMILNLAITSGVDDPNFNEQLKVDHVRAYSIEELAAAGHPVSPDADSPSKAPVAPGEAPMPYWGAYEGMPDGLNTAYYAAHNPDVVAAKLNMVEHYIEWGRKEGRLPFEGAQKLSATELAYHGVGFDYKYYAEQNPDVAASGLNLLYHYREYGRMEGRLPFAGAEHPYWGKVENVIDGFNAAYYISHNKDVGGSGLNPLYHWMEYGKAEGRLAYDPTAVAPQAPAPVTPQPEPTPVPQPVPVPDPQPHPQPQPEPVPQPVPQPQPQPQPEPQPEPVPQPQPTPTPQPTPSVPVTPAPANPNDDYWGENVGMPGGFNAVYYLAHNPDVAAARMDPLQHWLRYGKDEGRAAFDVTDVPSDTNHAYWGAVGGVPDGFNVLYYAAHNPDVVATGVDLRDHWMSQGKLEGRLAFAPSEGDVADVYWGMNLGMPGGFNAVYYLAHNLDVAAAGVDPLRHWLDAGRAEGRAAYDPLDLPSSTNHAYWGAVNDHADGFNREYYAAHNPDVVAAGLDLQYHYETYGKVEGRLAYDHLATPAGTAPFSAFVVEVSLTDLVLDGVGTGASANVLNPADRAADGWVRGGPDISMGHDIVLTGDDQAWGNDGPVWTGRHGIVGDDVLFVGDYNMAGVSRGDDVFRFDDDSAGIMNVGQTHNGPAMLNMAGLVAAINAPMMDFATTSSMLHMSGAEHVILLV